jgi:hypothetical protein
LLAKLLILPLPLPLPLPPRCQESDWQEPVPVEAGTVREQTIELNGGHRWRRVELSLQTATESGDSVMWFWSNLPDTVSAEQIADLYRRRWSIEGMFQRLESVLDSEIESLGSPRAALLGFASAVWPTTSWRFSSAVWSRLIARRSQRHGRHRLFTWPCKCAVGMRACRSRCPPIICYFNRPQRLWRSACWRWPETSNPNRWPKAYEVPKSPSPRNGWRAGLQMLMCRRLACLRPIKRKHLERAGCKSETIISRYRSNGYVHAKKSPIRMSHHSAPTHIPQVNKT